jgi:3-deoxy-D-manno-octulosonic-acid transferase
MRRLYNRLFIIFFWLASPYYFFKMWRRGNWREGLGQRFGIYDTRLKHALTNRQVIWLHAVSVGEVNICTQLIQALEPRVPNLKIVVSTTTTTGMAELQKKLPRHIEKIYYPIDRRRYVLRALTTLHPLAIVLVEAEIWPNFLWHAHDREIPLFLINTRLTDRSFRGYRRYRRLFRPIFASFTAVGTQNAADADRVRELGCRPEAIHILGSLKFDAAKIEERRHIDVRAMLRQLGIADEARILIGGSTHAGEEAFLARLFQRLKTKFPDLFLVLVPRHFERSRKVGKELTALGVKFAFRTDLTSGRNYPPGSVDCLLVNTTGELKSFYEFGSVVFIGKSLTAKGGQNPIEPGALGKAMVFGPNMQNFEPIASSFVSRQGALQVADASQLETVVETLLADEKLRLELGQNAMQVVNENRGALERTVDIILASIKHQDVYTVDRPEAGVTGL